jgi:hypothetical protein
MDGELATVTRSTAAHIGVVVDFGLDQLDCSLCGSIRHHRKKGRLFVARACVR